MIGNRILALLFGLLPGLLAACLAMLGAASAPAAAEGIEDKLQICSSCHGDDGRPIDPTIPAIWGQTEYFLVKQLHDYKSGDRESAVMAGFARRLTQAELRPAAAWLSKKPWPARETPAAAVPPPDGIAVCQICHQPGFAGGLPAPRLAGQSYEYLVEAMRSFADGERTNNADMVKIMQELSPARREEIARYIAGL
jgi:cytochrome c553